MLSWPCTEVLELEPVFSWLQSFNSVLYTLLPPLCPASPRLGSCQRLAGTPPTLPHCIALKALCCSPLAQPLGGTCSPDQETVTSAPWPGPRVPKDIPVWDSIHYNCTLKFFLTALSNAICSSFTLLSSVSCLSPFRWLLPELTMASQGEMVLQ